MRKPSLAVCCTGWATAAMIVAWAAPTRPDKAALFTAGVAALIGVCVAAGRITLQHTAGRLRTILREEQAATNQAKPWVTMVAQRRSVRLGPGGERLDYPGFMIRSGIGTSVVAQRWLPYSDDATYEDDERLIADLRVVCNRLHRDGRRRSATAARSVDAAAVPGPVAAWGRPGPAPREARGCTGSSTDSANGVP